MDTNLIKDKAAWAVTRLHNELYRRTGGKLAGKAGGQEFLLLTTTGRKSGQPRTTPL
ncbi:MAG TPA: nitroreductase/quinone reductase family protein, partial [Acidimicrobiia bacterium]|nr:nitroreductase/quinone reductase family protein [Acidimicrobiia bacterium]